MFSKPSNHNTLRCGFILVKYNQDDRQPKKIKLNVTLDDTESIDVNINTEIPEMKYSLWELHFMVNCAGNSDSIRCKLDDDNQTMAT